MDAIHAFATTVAFGDVDRDERLQLPGVFRLLQEAAIQQADRWDSSPSTLGERDHSWVLNRIGVHLARYPRFGDGLEVRTWSTGIRGFRGYREFRIVQGDETVVSGSSVWLYVDLATRGIIRVPADVANRFPTVDGPAFDPGLERRPWPGPAETAPRHAISVRYSDLDANGHVNNTAYADYLQTALVHHGWSPHPAAVRLKFMQEIPPHAAQVEVRCERAGAVARCAIGGPDRLYAQAEAEWS